jgi:hypothetical protein
MEGIEGRSLYTSERLGTILGPCTVDVIEEEGTYNDGDSAAELLQPFFEKVFDRCGARRP